MPRLFTEEEIVEYLMSTHPGPLGALDAVFKSDAAAQESWEAHVEHLEAGGFTVGREVE